MEKSLKKTIYKALIILIIITGASVGGYWGYQAWMRNRQYALEAAMSNMASVETAAVMDISEIVTASGVVNLNKEESVYASASQRVLEVLVEEGDRVNKDQAIILYDIEDKRDQLNKQIEQTEINLNNMRLTLRSMTAPASGATIRQLQSSVDAAEKTLFDARSGVTSSELRVSDQYYAITRAQESLELAQENIISVDRSIGSAMDTVLRAEQRLNDAEEERDKQKIIYDIGGISETDYKRSEDAVDSATDVLRQSRDAFESARDSRRQAEDAQSQAERAVEMAQTTLSELQLSLKMNKNNVNTAERSLSTARSNLSEGNMALVNEVERINFQQQENQIRVLELDLSDLRRQLWELTESVTCPMSGTVISVKAAQGMPVDTSSVLLTIADLNDLIVTANISEFDIPKLEIGQPVVMTTDSIGTEYKGEISRIFDTALTQSATIGTETVVPVEITFDRKITDLKPGFNLDLEITVAHNPNAVTVPITSLQRDISSGGYRVFVVEGDADGGTLKQRPVVRGITGNMVVEIVSGVEEGERIVETPTNLIYDGMTMNELRTALVLDRSSPGMFGNSPGMGGGVRAQTRSSRRTNSDTGS